MSVTESLVLGPDMRTYGNLVVMKWCSRHLSGAVMKKKPRKFEEGMSSIAHICPEAITYLKKVGKYLQEDKDEQEKLVRVFQRKDGGYRWGIMSRPLGLELGVNGRGRLGDSLYRHGWRRSAQERMDLVKEDSGLSRVHPNKNGQNS
ncbi:hypothetical protein DAI22_06g153300 [Oryza sativa Japonica Group]|nr:hypothetical protein DAI22_06g153300 [Oryza sativa Japonica Group]